MNELVEKSTKSIKAYAESIGADYEFIRGIVFKPRIAHKLDLPCQKLVYLDERFDEYDNVLMVDADMFLRNGATEDIFAVEKGIGRHLQIQTELRRKLIPFMQSVTGRVWGTEQTPYWGGAVFILSKEVRKAFREVLDDDVCLAFARYYHDEGIMYALAERLGIKESDEEFMGQPLYMDGQKWNWSSFDDGIEDSHFIHIRTKITPKGPKRTKLENYYSLVERGLIKP